MKKKPVIDENLSTVPQQPVLSGTYLYDAIVELIKGINTPRRSIDFKFTDMHLGNAFALLANRTFTSCQFREVSNGLDFTVIYADDVVYKVVGTYTNGNNVTVPFLRRNDDGTDNKFLAEVQIELKNLMWDELQRFFNNKLPQLIFQFYQDEKTIRVIENERVAALIRYSGWELCENTNRAMYVDQILTPNGQVMKGVNIETKKSPPSQIWEFMKEKAIQYQNAQII